jgi:hypothetical protein
MTTMTRDDLSDELCQEVVRLVETRTLDEGISLRDAAQICRELAAECRDRAAGFEEEADAGETKEAW